MDGVAVGRIVHYFHPAFGWPRAAMIVHDNGGKDGSVNLKVFLDTDDAGRSNDGYMWRARNGDVAESAAFVNALSGDTLWQTSVIHKSAVVKGAVVASYWDWPARV